MKALRKKVILSAVVLLFALVATIGSTYAWFTITDTANVATPTLQIQAVDSLLIKLAAHDATQDDANNHKDATQYKQGISASDLTSHPSYSNITSWTLYPVTSIINDYSALKAGAFNKLGVGDTRPLSGIGAGDYNTTATGKVIRIKFWLMSQSDDNYVKVRNVTITGQSSSGVNTLIEGSTRIAVTKASDSNGYIYGNTGAIDFDFTFAGTSQAYTGGEPSPANGFNTLDQHTLDLSTTLESSNQLGTNASQICELDTLAPVLVIVDIFIEGWDSQATGQIIAGALQVSFNFTIAE
jgi:hypothetical protein